MGAFGAQRADRQRLGSRPVDALAGFERLSLGFELPRDLAVEVKALRHGHEAVADFAQ